jgi:hypothetical protein
MTNSIVTSISHHGFEGGSRKNPAHSIAALDAAVVPGDARIEDGKLTIFRRSGTYYARIRISPVKKYVWRTLKTSNDAIRARMNSEERHSPQSTDRWLVPYPYAFRVRFRLSVCLGGCFTGSFFAGQPVARLSPRIGNSFGHVSSTLRDDVVRDVRYRSIIAITVQRFISTRQACKRDRERSRHRKRQAR